MAKKRAARAGRAKKAAKKRVGRPAKKTTRKSTAKPAKRASGKRAGRGRRPAAKKSAPAAEKSAPAAESLLTLTEVSKQTGISMPTLQRYKKVYQRRLQTVGKGRTQRYKPESLDTFRKIKEENLKKRGRPRKVAARKVAQPAPQAETPPAGLISLSEIGRRTAISYPTLLRYVRLHGRKIPSHGTGRKRRFPVEAVPVFSQLRKESRRGRRKGSAPKRPAAGGLAGRVKQLEKSQAKLEKKIRKLVKALQRPLVKGL